MLSKEKKIMAVSFLAGVVLFTATAFADITAKSGYDTYKKAIKNTASAFSKELDSFTFETAVTLKDNERVLATNKMIAKADIKNNISENTDTGEYFNGLKELSYSYSDNNSTIHYSPQEDTYNVYEYYEKDKRPSVNTRFSNPFEEERAKDFEKVFDALVGDLKNYVVVQEKNDGSKEVFGELNESQIPTVANALASLGVKQFVNEMSSRRYNNDKFDIPELVDEIYIKKVKGNARISKDNIIEYNSGTFTISGKDKNGNIHNIIIDVAFNIYDINSTKISKPDLTGKKVEKRKNDAVFYRPEIDKKYLGKWKNEITEIKNGEIDRKAERFIIIKSVDSEYLKGTYTAKYNDAGKRNITFDFEAKIFENNQAEFQYTNNNGNKETIMLNFNPTEIFLSPMESHSLESGQFYKVFEE